MMYPLACDLAGEGIPVTVSCRVLGFSTTAFHAWRKSPVSQRDWDDAHLINAAMDVHGDDPEFGYRLIADELIHAMGSTVGENRVARLCSLQGISSTIIKRRGPGKKAGPAVHDDRVMRDFTAEALNVKWLVGITEHWTAWIPRIVATLAYLFSWSRAYRRSAGVSQLSAFRGRSLSSLATC